MAENTSLKFTLSQIQSELLTPSPARIAILPAAGESQRMGRHKLSLPLGSRSLIQQAVENYLAAAVDLVVIVRRPDDQHIVEALEPNPGVVLVTPEIAPADMKKSIQFAIEAVCSIREILPGDIFLLSPPDMPFLKPDLISFLLGYWVKQKHQCDFLSPVLEGRKGHPLLFSERVARHVDDIPADKGFDFLQKSGQFQQATCPVDDSGIFFDVDTPEAYQEALQRLSKNK